jgi:glucosamine--fructose-6-phosphate aminotransferase (isomerizing)
LDTYVLQLLTQENDPTLAPYPHWTLKEIKEQPLSAFRTMDGRLYSDFVYFSEFQKDPIYDRLLCMEHIIVLGCGTSYFAGQYGVSFLKELCDFTTVQLFEGAEFSEKDIPKKGTTALILLSQSGETKDLHRCIEIGRKHLLCILGVINVEDSRIAREVDAVCYLKAGREVGVASTKTYTSQVICMALFAVWFAQQKNLNRSKRMQYIHDLDKLSLDIQVTLEENESMDLVSMFKDKQHCFLLGRGTAESVAKEGSLKIKEITYLHSEGYATSSLKHGPFSLLDEDFPVILLDPYQDPKIENAFHEIKARHAPMVWIGPNPKKSDHCISITVSENQTFGSLLCILPLQLLAYHLSVFKGLDPDFPRNLAKVVTVE